MNLPERGSANQLPRMHPHTVSGIALLTDLYQLTMVQAYWREQLNDEAVFSLFVRRLPPSRNFLLACGLDDALHFLETLRFTPEQLDFLGARPEFEERFVRWLADFRFRGEVRAVPEGTPVFAGEPILEVIAPLPQAQLAETLVLNQVHLQTMLASKAARVVLAARGRSVVDFGMRRMHGTDAALKGARAFYVAGVAATSNVLAGQVYGVPIAGTMAHSYIQVHASELDAFRAFSAVYPETVLLVDTYDTLEGVRRVIRLAGELGDGFRVRAVRLDSGDLLTLARETRTLLNQAGLARVQIFASGGLDETEVGRLVEKGAPIDAFGVGTAMGVSADAPSLDMVYKLTQYAGEGRIKLSAGKTLLPGPKQILREEIDGIAAGDVIAGAREKLPGRPLLQPVMREGRRLPAGKVTLDATRRYAAEQIAMLSPAIRALSPADPRYPVEISTELGDLERRLKRKVTDDLDDA
jgi:nicotinate phosphoribosyltransferase